MSMAKLKLRGVAFVDEANVNPAENTVEINNEKVSVDKLPLDAPVSGTIYGTLLNYKGALAAMGDALNEAPYKEAPKAPVLYLKPVNTISSYNAAIPIPEGIDELEIGASLGIVIGKTATRVAKENAFDYIAGYTVVNDVSVPHANFHRPAISQKSRDAFCPVGPWVIEQSAVANPDALGIRVYINNELKQENTTANLVRNVATLIADVTDFMTLNAGDVLLVGVPENAPLAKANDLVRIEIDGVGKLENTVVKEAELVRGATV